jgi:hypothetical protein
MYLSTKPNDANDITLISQFVLFGRQISRFPKRSGMYSTVIIFSQRLHHPDFGNPGLALFSYA